MQSTEGTLFTFVNKLLNKFLKYFSVFFIFASIYIFIANITLYNKESSLLYKYFPKINFGLDIKGGTQLKIAPNFNKLYEQKYQDFILNLPDLAWSNDFAFKQTKVAADGMEIVFESPDDLLKFQKTREGFNIDGIACKFLTSDSKASCAIQDNKKLQKEEIEKLVTIIKNRVDGMQVKEIAVNRDGEDKIAVLIPKGIDLLNIKSVILKIAKLSFHSIPQTSLNAKNIQKNLNLVKKFKFQGTQNEIELSAQSLLSGNSVEYARASKDEMSKNVIYFKLNAKGRDDFAKITKENTGKPLAIVMDDEIVSMPMIREPILSGSASISGNFSEEEARNLAIVLKSGSISTDIKIIEEKNINFALSKAFENGIQKAILFTFIAVFMFMFIRYRILGILSCIGLLLNFIITVAVAAIFGFTITIPSFAGMILMLGMSIDINILVYERMKEFAGNGNFSFGGMRKSFDIVQKTIADSNLTTILAVASLLSFGDSFLKGFAIILITGIISSIFSCFYISKNILDFYFKKFKR